MRVHHVIDAAVNNVDHLGGTFEVPGVFRGEQNIHGLAEQQQPAVKLRTAHFGEGNEFGMGREGIPHKTTPAENHGFPEGNQSGQMSLPVGFGDLFENEAPQIILLHALVKGIDELPDFRAALEVGK